VVLKVVDIEPQGSIGPSKGLINSHGVEWGSLNGQGSMNNCWGLLEQWSLQFKIIVNQASRLMQTSFFNKSNRIKKV